MSYRSNIIQDFNSTKVPLKRLLEDVRKCKSCNDICHMNPRNESGKDSRFYFTCGEEVELVFLFGFW